MKVLLLFHNHSGPEEDMLGDIDVYADLRQNSTIALDKALLERVSEARKSGLFYSAAQKVKHCWESVFQGLSID